MMSGYSANVRGWLHASGQRYELAQVGPDFCILRDPAIGKKLAGETVDLFLQVDLDTTRKRIKILQIDGLIAHTEAAQ